LKLIFSRSLALVNQLENKFNAKLILLLLMCNCAPVGQESISDSQDPSAVKALMEKSSQKVPAEKIEVRKLSKGSNFYELLKNLNFERSDSFNLIEAAKKVHSVSKLQAGTEFRFKITEKNDLNEEKIESMTIVISQTEQAQCERLHENWKCKIITFDITADIVDFQGQVDLTLWGSATAAGMDPGVVIKLSEVFAWQLDFNREIRAGDRWRLTVERLNVNGKKIGWGNILAAEYVNHGESFMAIRFPQTGTSKGYFDSEGISLRKMFLKSPIKFGRVTSRFNRRRFHPILKRKIPHNGVDYGARKGTPVYAVGDGKVVRRGYKSASGNYIKIRHNSVYQTSYAHLNGFARGLRKGRKVKQGEVIGYVGSTGRATGPHLHFAFFERRRFVDPLGVKFPNAAPVPKNKLSDFKQMSAHVTQKLPLWLDDDVISQNQL
jgi:murein DD-endopeptidase MepM/ murein hydrolase activator NlpD